MNADFTLALKFWFDMAIKFLTSVKLPGTNVTPLAMLFFGACAYIGLKFVISIFNSTSSSLNVIESRVIRHGGNRGGSK